MSAASGASRPQSKTNRSPPGREVRGRRKSTQASRPLIHDQPGLLCDLASTGLPGALAVVLHLAARNGPATLVSGLEDQQPTCLITDQRAGRRRHPGKHEGHGQSSPIDSQQGGTILARHRCPEALPVRTSTRRGPPADGARIGVAMAASPASLT